jgi:hypothetical protein
MIAEHIQSYAFAIEKSTLLLFIAEGIFAPTLDYGKQKMDFVVAHEVRMSSLLLKRGYEIKEFYQPPKNASSNFTPYFGGRIALSPFEVMFVKTNAFMRFDERQLAIGGTEKAPSGKRVVKAPLPVIGGTNMLTVPRAQLLK